MTAPPIETPTRGLFGVLSALRGRRIFHPQGIGHEATPSIPGPVPGERGVPLLEGAGRHPAIVRLSRGAGLPEPLPDVLGLAMRLLDVHGPGRHQDFLLVSSASPPLGRHLLLPGLGGFGRQTFSSLLAYRFAGRLRLVGA